MNVRTNIIREQLNKYSQEHLLNFYNELGTEDQEKLLKQISKIDFEKINKLYEMTKKEIELKNDIIEPIEYVDKARLTVEEYKELEEIGERIIKSGKFAVSTMAGGQGTRLGHNGPKGSFYLFPDKSLYEIVCNTLKEANRKYNVVLPWYIMTSRENNDDTLEFFERNNYFGYPKSEIFFFTQDEFPIIDKNGKLILESKGKIKEAADGNGGIFDSMLKSGVIKDLEKRKVQWIFIGPVDNPLLRMVDPILLGLSEKSGVLGASKTVTKANPHEKVGAFCIRNGRPSVIEYTELPKEMAVKTHPDGDLYFGESHIMCNLFHIKALKKIGQEKLPYHIALKKAEYIDEYGNLIEPKEPNCYKFESFIFDAFETLDKIAILRSKREEEFAPVKNADGVDSPETARELYLNYHKKIQESETYNV